MPTFTRRSLQLLFLALALAATRPCLAVEDPAPLQADATSAVLNGDARNTGLWDSMGLVIVSLDGKSLGKGLFGARYPSSVRLTPGRHAVRLAYRTPTYTASGDMWLDAEAGKAYSIRLDHNGGAIHMWMAETATGRPVGGLDDGSGGRTVAANTRQGPVPTEVPAELPVADATTALLVCDPGKQNWNDIHAQSRLRIQSVDGVRQYHTGSHDQVVTLSPGHHALALQYEAGRGGIMGSLQEFDAVAGKTYVVHQQLVGYSAAFWIEQAGTGIVVSGSRPSPEPPSPPPAPDKTQ